MSETKDLSFWSNFLFPSGFPESSPSIEIKEPTKDLRSPLSTIRHKYLKVKTINLGLFYLISVCFVYLFG